MYGSRFNESIKDNTFAEIWAQIASITEPLCIVIQERNIPKKKAPVIRNGSVYAIPKTIEDISIARTGLYLIKNPLRMIPLNNISSRIGARIQMSKTGNCLCKQISFVFRIPCIEKYTGEIFSL